MTTPGQLYIGIGHNAQIITGENGVIIAKTLDAWKVHGVDVRHVAALPAGSTVVNQAALIARVARALHDRDGCSSARCEGAGTLYYNEAAALLDARGYLAAREDPAVYGAAHDAAKRFGRERNHQ